jgi:hypothetical protein
MNIVDAPSSDTLFRVTQNSNYIYDHCDFKETEHNTCLKREGALLKSQELCRKK